MPLLRIFRAFERQTPGKKLWFWRVFFCLFVYFFLCNFITSPLWNQQNMFLVILILFFYILWISWTSLLPKSLKHEKERALRLSHPPESHILQIWKDGFCTRKKCFPKNLKWREDLRRLFTRLKKFKKIKCSWKSALHRSTWALNFFRINVLLCNNTELQEEN